MYNVRDCPLCGDIKLTLSDAYLEPWMIFHLYGWRFEGYQGMRIKAGTCQNCGFVFTCFRYDDIEMKRIYSDYMGERITNRRPFQPWIDNLCHDMDDFYSRRRSIYEGVLTSISRTGLHTALDYGGNGRCLPHCFEKYFCFDIGESKGAQGQIQQLTLYEDIKAIGRIDFILLAHVLEHVPKPSDLLRKVTTLMSPSTNLVIDVPYELSGSPNQPTALISGRKFCEHINLFSGKSILHLVEQCGLEVVQAYSGYEQWSPSWTMHFIRVIANLRVND